MSVRVQIGDEQDQRQQHHQRAGDVDRQVGQRDDREDRGDATDDAWQDRPGRGELGDDAVTGDDDQEGRDRRVDQRGEEDLPERHRHVIDDRAGCMKDEIATGPGDRSPVDRFQQRGRVGYFEVGDVQPDRFLGIDVDAVADCLLGPIRVAPVNGGEVADACHRVVEDFGAQVAGEVASGAEDWMRRADVGPGRHSHDVSRLGDEEPCRSGSGSARVDKDDHWHLRVEEAGDDVIHRGGDSTGSVEHDEERVRVVRVGAVDRGRDV